MSTIELPRSPRHSTADLRHIFGTFPSGVVGICAEVDGELVGMAASSFVVVSLEPALVAVCIQKTSRTWPRLAQSAHLGVSVLSGPQQMLARQLAGPADRRFEGVDFRSTPEGAILLEGAASTMVCSVFDSLSAGDHDVILLELRDFGHSELTEPLVFHRSSFRAIA
jgi:flavin reductase (DIM6/NTAB) family NADH-FMN oxidoreductase RutF